MSLPARGVRIEISDVRWFKFDAVTSLPARGVRIEIVNEFMGGNDAGRHSPRGECGLKCVNASLK